MNVGDLLYQPNKRRVLIIVEKRHRGEVGVDYYTYALWEGMKDPPFPSGWSMNGGLCWVTEYWVKQYCELL
jgi:hypothetical protein